MRKTVCYGKTTSKVDFEWPKENDLLQMLMNGPIRIQDLKYRTRSDKLRFSVFQLSLSNGILSPVFAAKVQNDQNLVSIGIKDYAIVKRVKGTKQQTTNFCINLALARRMELK